jgi:hypothetical protein
MEIITNLLAFFSNYTEARHSTKKDLVTGEVAHYMQPFYLTLSLRLTHLALLKSLGLDETA